MDGSNIFFSDHHIKLKIHNYNLTWFPIIQNLRGKLLKYEKKERKKEDESFKIGFNSWHTVERRHLRRSKRHQAESSCRRPGKRRAKKKQRRRAPSSLHSRSGEWDRRRIWIWRGGSGIDGGICGGRSRSCGGRGGGRSRSRSRRCSPRRLRGGDRRRPSEGRGKAEEGGAGKRTTRGRTPQVFEKMPERGGGGQRGPGVTERYL